MNSEYDQSCGGQYNVYTFHSKPHIEEIDTALEGGVLRPGCRINGMFGRKTSSGFFDFHPIAPQHLVYLGRYRNNGNELVICSVGGLESDEIGELDYFGWHYFPDNEGFNLMSNRTNGVACPINSTYVFLDEDMPPEACIKDLNYWKKQSKIDGVKVNDCRRDMSVEPAREESGQLLLI